LEGFVERYLGVDALMKLCWILCC